MVTDTRCKRCKMTPDQEAFERRYGGTFMCWVGYTRYDKHDWRGNVGS